MAADNFREDIDVEAFQFEVSGPYIMYENAQHEVQCPLPLSILKHAMLVH